MSFFKGLLTSFTFLVITSGALHALDKASSKGSKSEKSPRQIVSELQKEIDLSKKLEAKVQQRAKVLSEEKQKAISGLLRQLSAEGQAFVLEFDKDGAEFLVLESLRNARLANETSIKAYKDILTQEEAEILGSIYTLRASSALQLIHSIPLIKSDLKTSVERAIDNVIDDANAVKFEGIVKSFSEMKAHFKNDHAACEKNSEAQKKAAEEGAKGSIQGFDELLRQLQKQLEEAEEENKQKTKPAPRKTGDIQAGVSIEDGSWNNIVKKMEDPNWFLNSDSHI